MRFRSALSLSCAFNRNAHPVTNGISNAVLSEIEALVGCFSLCELSIPDRPFCCESVSFRAIAIHHVARAIQAANEVIL